MKKRIAILFNEPTIKSGNDKVFVTEKIKSSELTFDNLISMPENLIDMSEVGVLEEKEDIQKVLENNGYEAVIFNVSDDIELLIQFLKSEKIDLIFNIVESLGEESIHEMHVAGIYNLLNINFTGSDAKTLSLCLDKIRAKEILIANKISTPNFTNLDYGERFCGETINLNYPVIVKYRAQDASIGIANDSVASNFDDLSSKIYSLWELQKEPLIIEEYIDGRELNVAVIGNKNPIALPISEIVFDTLPEELPKIVSYNSKWMKGTVEYENTVGVCPAKIADELRIELQKSAVKIFKIFGLRDYARIDFRLDKNNKPFVLEVNPNPDITDEAGFARSAKTFGFTYDEIVLKIVEMAFDRTK